MENGEVRKECSAIMANAPYFVNNDAWGCIMNVKEDGTELFMENFLRCISGGNLRKIPFSVGDKTG